MSTFYITKYALTIGIFSIESEAIQEEYHKGAEYRVKDTRSGYLNSFSHSEAFPDYADALLDAEKRRGAKLASLRKQIAKLEKLTFVGHM